MNVLVLVGQEVSPRGRNHYLAFGLDHEIDHSGLDAAGICRAVRAGGGFGFAAHPFSHGSSRFKRAGPGMPFDGLDSTRCTGSSCGALSPTRPRPCRSIPGLVRFLALPAPRLEHPPERNTHAWDELCLGAPR